MFRRGLAYVIMISVLVFLVGGCEETTTEPEICTVTFNLTCPDEELDGHEISASLWTDWGDETPYVIEDTTISGISTTIIITDVASGTYHLMVVIDSQGDGFSEEGPVEQGDVFWGALNVEINEDKTISVPENYWQYYHSIVFGIQGIPSGHNGELIGTGIFEDGANILEFNTEPLMGGLGFVYNNAALIAMEPTDYWDDSLWYEWQLESGNYDVWILVDHDGTIEEWEDSSETSPITIDDLYYSFDYDFDSADFEDYWKLVTGTFSNIVGITGTVSCSTWNDTGGDTYVMAFPLNPLEQDSLTGVEPFAMDILEEPGAYSLPMFAGDSAIVVGFWDADNSGTEEGPTQGDYMGGYGFDPEMMTLEWVICNEFGTANIDFELYTPFDTTGFGGY